VFIEPASVGAAWRRLPEAVRPRGVMFWNCEVRLADVRSFVAAFSAVLREQCRYYPHHHHHYHHHHRRSHRSHRSRFRRRSNAPPKLGKGREEGGGGEGAQKNETKEKIHLSKLSSPAKPTPTPTRNKHHHSRDGSNHLPQSGHFSSTRKKK